MRRLDADPRVIGLIAVGSMAAVDYLPDAWSDHDFLVIVPSGRQEELRRDLAWLPWFDDIVLSFRETEHGLKVLYRDGHMLEFAIFDLEEIGLASVNRYRVLLDRGGIEQRIREVVAQPPRDQQPDDVLFGMFVTNIQVGIGRTARGERLSGRFFITSATRYLCALLARTLPSEQHGLLDEFDPLRRFERAYPELGAEIDAAEPKELLRIAKRELEQLRPELAWDALDAVLLR